MLPRDVLVPYAERYAELFAEPPAEGFVTIRFLTADPVMDVQGKDAVKFQFVFQRCHEQQQADGITAPGKRAHDALTRSKQGIFTNIVRCPSFHPAPALPFPAPRSAGLPPILPV